MSALPERVWLIDQGNGEVTIQVSGGPRKVDLESLQHGPSVQVTAEPGQVWVYALHDPRPGCVYAYVGRSNDPMRRYGEHMSSAWMAAFDWDRRGRRLGRPINPKELWLLDLIDWGLWPELWLLEIVEVEERDSAEGRWRKSYRERGWDLLNIEGVWIAERTGHPNAPSPPRGQPLPEAWREAISEGLKRAKPRPPVSEAERERRRRARLGQRASNETRAKMSASHIARWAAPGYREMMAEGRRGRTLSPEHLQAIREANQRPEVQAKRSAAAKAHWAAKTPEERSAIARERERRKKEKRDGAT